VKKVVLLTTFALNSLFIMGCTDENEESKDEGKIFSATEETELTTYTTHNPTVEEMFELNPNIDIFLFENIVYETNIEWVNELSLTKGDLIGVIEFNASNPSEFTNLTANILPIGAKIYTSNERGDILIAEHGNEIKYYYQLVEG
jgi:hypothetical protein